MGDTKLDTEAKKSKTSVPGKRLSSVTVSARLLKSFSEEEPELGISLLARRLGVSKSTVHRLASTLVAEGLLEQNPETEKYRLGLSLFTLGALVRRRMDVYTLAKPHLTELRRDTNEAVHLAILSGPDVLFVNDLQSAHAIRLRPLVGTTKPAFCTAEGLAMLAFAPQSTVDALLAGPLEARAENTVTDPDAIRDVLETVRRQGFAIEDEESEVGVRCVAAPIFSAAGAVSGAVSVAGPRQRLSKKALASFAPSVIRTAEAISAQLGYQVGGTFADAL